VENKDRDLVATRAIFGKLLLDTGSPEASVTGGTSETSAKPGSHDAPEPFRFELPVNLDGKNTAVFLSHPSKVRKQIEPVNESYESTLLSELLQELTAKFLTDLASLTCEEGYLSQEEATEATCRYIVIGGSHAGRLADCLDDLGLEVIDLSVPGWTVTEKNVEKAVADLEKELKVVSELDTVIIYQLFDNSVYFEVREDGLRSLPSKVDGKYHMVGELHMAERPVLKSLFSQALPLFRAGGENLKVIISLMMRYIAGSCCTNSAHLTNKGTIEYKTTMGERLVDMAMWLKDITFFKRVRIFRVLNPVDYVLEDGKYKKAAKKLGKMWEDPVHMKKEGYTIIAAAVTGLVAETESAHLAKDNDNKGGDGGCKNQTARRQSWVSTDDAVAVRRPDYTVDGGSRPHKWKGQQHGSLRGCGPWGRGGRRGYPGHGSR
jgi:hypothetical protein